MIATASTPAAIPSRWIRGYTRVPPGALEAIGRFPFHLYVVDSFGGNPVLYYAPDCGMEDAELLESVRQRDRAYYVRNADQEALSRRLRATMDHYLEREDVPAADRLAVLQVAVTTGLRTAFSLLRVEVAVDASQEVGRKIARLLQSATGVSPALLAIAQHNRDTMAHSINVSILAVTLAKELGIRGEGELAEIAVGAMLHDVGKRHIPAGILASSQPLSRKERQLIKVHPLRGYEEVCEEAGLSFGQLMMIYQHHERIDGKGYPVGVAGGEMHPWARLCSVVDVLEALTGRRPYRDAISDLEATKELEGLAGSALDKEIVTCVTRGIRSQRSNNSG